MLKQTSKVFAAVVISLALLASVVVAANVAANRQGVGVTLPQFARVLNLTQDQTTQVKGILTTLRQDAKAVFTSNKTKEEKRTELLSLREQARNSINSTLTIDQKEKADARNLVNRLLMPRKAGAAMRQALAQLNLTADQKTQIKGILKDAASRGKAIRQDTTLSKQDKMAKLQDNRRTARKDIASVLTSDQRAKFRQWMQNHRNGMAAGA